MSNEALLQNAKQVLGENRLEDVRKEIETAKYHFGLIMDKDIFLKKLIWMGPPAEWNTCTPSATTMGKIYGRLAPEGKSRSLSNIVERIRSNYSGSTSEQLLTALCEEDNWFGKHLSISTHFERLLLSPLWVRTLRPHEKNKIGENPKMKINFILRMGATAHSFMPFVSCAGLRSLCQFLSSGAGHGKHILFWAAGHDSGEQDLPPRALLHYFKRSTTDKYLDCLFNN